ncbi:hypothetical protein ROZALSC1DRAFT_21255 [Rozella allomycis CSF55]|uniref:CUE domain-containing protein n=1 Tax=Rozella allomycis (strain CSF55) TaxID=988480 RepID=A0A4P9YMY8_ROZAC|nr:hypothetical protein ROZALSC1DRAFT_21255 [Rozella allomycis CSF55]
MDFDFLTTWPKEDRIRFISLCFPETPENVLLEMLGSDFSSSSINNVFSTLLKEKEADDASSLYKMKKQDIFTIFPDVDEEFIDLLLNDLKEPSLVIDELTKMIHHEGTLKDSQISILAEIFPDYDVSTLEKFLKRHDGTLEELISFLSANGNKAGNVRNDLDELRDMFCNLDRDYVKKVYKKFRKSK